MSRTTASLITTSLILCAAAAPAWAQTNNVTIDTAGSPNADVSDWQDETCFADDACDEFPNQQDITGACIASDFDTNQPATTAYLRFDFDDTTVPGANTLDGCWLVDVNQNGMVDRGLCFSLGGSPVDLISAQLFTCADSSATTCAMLDVARRRGLAAGVPYLRGRQVGEQLVEDARNGGPANLAI